MLRGRPTLQELIERVVERGKEQGAVRTDTPTVLLAGVLATGTIYTTLFGYFDGVQRNPRAAAAMPTPEPFISAAFAVAWRGLEPD
jgi:hypothetical protein